MVPWLWLFCLLQLWDFNRATGNLNQRFSADGRVDSKVKTASLLSRDCVSPQATPLGDPAPPCRPPGSTRGPGENPTVGATCQGRGSPGGCLFVFVLISRLGDPVQPGCGPQHRDTALRVHCLPASDSPDSPPVHIFMSSSIPVQRLAQALYWGSLGCGPWEPRATVPAVSHR